LSSSQTAAPTKDDPATAPALAVAGVSKHYRDFAAVSDVTFDLGRGEFLTMLGPSGSGKTTTLRMIAGFVQPDSGEIRVSGTDVSRTPPHRRNIGMVFQNYALFPHMSAAKNVSFPLEMRGVDRRESQRRADEALELVGLHGHVERRPAELSGGQQQRVALARAIVFQPDLLLMDEPLGALDRKLRASMQIELMRIARETQATVISVTHDQEEALVMSDRIAIYNHGRIEQLGTAPELYDHPASLFVADFIGDSNIFRGRLGGSAGRPEVVGDGWSATVGEAAAIDHRSQAPVALVVRPEHLRLLPASRPPDDGALNTREGVVAEVVYLGAEWRYVIDLPGGTAALARVARSDAGEPMAPGDTVLLAWRPENGVLLPDEEAAT
jgi:putative spermidine/putrescine transport system ATP-binding protein